jgi:hypothetical protein
MIRVAHQGQCSVGRGEKAVQGGTVQRAKKPQQIRGLNRNHNHEMKDIFKGAANRASCGVGPLRDFYVALLDKGMKPEMVR